MLNKRIKIKNVWPVFLLFLSAIFLVFYKFNQIPKNLSDDEIEFAQLAFSLDKKSYTPYSPIAFGHSTLYFYIILFSFKLFGVNNFALRLPAAIFGIASVMMFYLLIRQCIKNYELRITNLIILPFLSALIFLSSRWFLTFSRFAFEATFLLFLELMSIYFLIKVQGQAKNTTSSFYLFISGLFAGLAFNSYTPGRIFFLLPLSYLILQLVNSLTHKQINSLTFKSLIYFIIPFLITITPLSVYLLKNNDPRFSEQFFFNNEKLTPTKKIEFLLKNIKFTALMFNFSGDMNGRHNFPGKPALNPILGSLFIFGLIITMKQRNNFNNGFFLFYFFLSLIPTLLTNPKENPNMLRTFTAIPSTVYFIFITLNHFWVVVESWSIKLKKLFYYFILFSIFFSSGYELRTYFHYQSHVFRNSFGIKCSLETIINNKGVIPKNCRVSRNEF